MTPEQKSLNDFIGTPNIVFEIPIYQRNYVWKASQCEQLYNDIVSIIQGKANNHFFGSIIYKPYKREGGSYTEYQIIDGQQRLTTMCLLLLAMRNIVLGDDSFSEEDKETADGYTNEYLNCRKIKRLKLKSIAKDSLAYQEIFDKKEIKCFSPEVKNHNIVINYNLLVEWIRRDLKANKYAFDDFDKSLGNLNFVAIKLEPTDANPQIIFDSMNSTGIGLKPGDNIRKFLLMDIEDPDLQRQLFNEQWCKIENNSCPNNIMAEKGVMVTEFVWTWLKLMRKTGTIKRDRTYREFKDYVAEEKLKNEDVLKTLGEYSEMYKILINGKGSHALNCGTESDYIEIDRIISRLNYIKITTYYTFALALLFDCWKGMIPIGDVLNVFRLLESYLFRRVILNQPTNAYNKFFPSLHSDIRKVLKNTQRYSDVFQSIIVNQKNRLVFPDDGSFKEALLKRDLYTEVKKERLKYLLDRLNNYNSNKEYFDTLKNDTITIEHVMPQSLTREWKLELGDDYKEVHERFLHKLGNLSLTGYNIEYSNKSSGEKKICENGFSNCQIRMNKSISEMEHWRKIEMENRGISLADKALEIWSKPISDITDTLEHDTLTLSSELDDFTGKKFVKLYITLPDADDPEDCTPRLKSGVNATDMSSYYVAIFKYLHKQKEYNLNRIINDDNEEVSFISRDKCNMRTPIEIDDNVYVETHLSNYDKAKFLKKVMDYFDLDSDCIEFVVKK